MRLPIFSSLLLFISIFSLFQAPTFAEKKDYIVYLGSHPRQLDSSIVDHDHAAKYHLELLGLCLGSIKKAKSSIFYSYNRFINGFAAVLEDEDVVKVKNHPKVISVFVNHGRTIRTTHSWKFLGLENDNSDVPLNSLWKKTNFGEDIIIGNLDTGIWPESKSFSDQGMGPVPTRWRGTCQTYNRDGVKCNRKLIGIRYFNRGYLKYARRHARRENKTYTVTTDFMTARDYDGHGTHTLATAGGNFVANVNVSGQGNGTAKGGSPRARVAAYKVCWELIEDKTCFEADILAAMEAAISDGVDVLSISLSGGGELFADGCAIGSFHAVKNGIVVVAAAGNSGPTPETVANVAPWIFTVGASTMNRDFVNYVTLGNKKVIKGLGLPEKPHLVSQKFYPLMTGADARAKKAPPVNASACHPGTLDPKKVNGTILVCLWLDKDVAPETGTYAAELGAVGLILANGEQLANIVEAQIHNIPTSKLNFRDGGSLFAYINSTKNPIAQISDSHTEYNGQPAPAVINFSSRGPNNIDPNILKPDITAPGVNVIAAAVEQSSTTKSPFKNRTGTYSMISGTSMACPHVSGIVGVLKSAHPDWSPAAIRSAVMTTASTKDGASHPMIDHNTYGDIEATPFAYGAGHINPNSALDPGLVYDLNAEDYLNYLCAHAYNESVIKMFTISDKPYLCPKEFKESDLNYPSIVVSSLNGSIVVTRNLKNVGSPGTYNVSVRSPAGVSISIEPSILKFEKYGEEKKFTITFSPKANDSSKGYLFGELIWSDGHHNVTSPIVVKKE